MSEYSEDERSELIQVVGQVLQDLTPPFAALLVRRVVDDMTADAIAEELGISICVAERRLHQATRAFQGKIARALRPIKPLNRQIHMLLPFGVGALLPPVDPRSPEHIEKVGREVWQRVARELELPEELSPARLSPTECASDPPASGVRLIQAGNEPLPLSARRLADAALPFVERVLKETIF
jgi:hypothetical protein